MPKVELHLRLRVEPSQQDALKEFLCRAGPYYEQPGGIEVVLLRLAGEVDRFIEVVRYVDERTFEADQARVENDPRMKELLAEWRTLLAEPPVIEVYREVR